MYKRDNLEIRLVEDDNNKRKKCKISEEEEEEKICSRWAHLPHDLLEQILKHLPLRDWKRLCAVCSPWRAAIVNAITKKHCLPLRALPLIVLPSLKKLILHYLNKQDVLVCTTIPLSEGTETCHGSVEGWLIVSKYAGVNSLAISFLNPMTDARILVPPLLQYYSSNPSDQVEVHMTEMVASSNPSCSDRCCFVAVLFVTHYCGIAFCRLCDNSWTIIKASTGDNFKDIEIHDGKLYVITDHAWDSILVYDLGDQYPDYHHPKPKVLAKRPQPRPAMAPDLLPVAPNLLYQMHPQHQPAPNLNLFPMYPSHPLLYCPDSGEVNVQYFLVNDDASRDLLLIRMLCNLFGEHPRVTTIELFKLDMNDQWVKAESLGDRVLFLSKIQCTIMSSKTVLSIEDELITRNSIYFAFRLRWAARSRFLIGMFCFTNNTIKHFSVDKLSVVDTLYPFWFTPSTAW